MEGYCNINGFDLIFNKVCVINFNRNALKYKF